MELWVVLAFLSLRKTPAQAGVQVLEGGRRGYPLKVGVLDPGLRRGLSEM